MNGRSGWGSFTLIGSPPLTALPVPANAEGTVDASLVGADIRALRKSRGLKLNEVALKIGRSVGFVSQLERGLSDPSLSDLRKLATALDVPIGFFFSHQTDHPNEAGTIVRAQSRRRLGTSADGLFEELLSPDLGGAFEMFHSVFGPGAELDAFLHRETEEAGYVVSGAMTLFVGDRRYEIGAGDSFRFHNEPYRWHNPHDDPCVIIWAIAPPVY